MGFFDKIQDTINTAAEQTKTKSQDVQLKRERRQKLEALGEQAYSLYANGQLTQAELTAGCEAVAQVDQQLQDAYNQMQAGRPPQQEAVPPQPGVAPPPQAPAQPGAAPAAPPAPPQQQAVAPPPPPAPPQAEAGSAPPPPPPPSEET